jgi:hypothetical protein
MSDLFETGRDRYFFERVGLFGEPLFSFFVFCVERVFTWPACSGSSWAEARPGC